MMENALKTACVLILLNGTAHAHHGKDYIEIEGYASPEKGEYLLFSLVDYHVPQREISDLTYWRIVPGILYGVTDRLGFEAHSHISKTGGGDFKYDASAIEARFRIGEENVWPVNLAGSIEYELSASDEADEIELRLILGRNFGMVNATFNYWGNQGLSKKEPLVSNYGIGGNRSLFIFQKMSLELVGTLFNGNEHYIIPSFYLPVTERISIKAGLAIGISRISEDFSFRSALHLMF